MTLHYRNVRKQANNFRNLRTNELAYTCVASRTAIGRRWHCAPLRITLGRAIDRDRQHTGRIIKAMSRVSWTRLGTAILLFAGMLFLATTDGAALTNKSLNCP